MQPLNTAFIERLLIFYNKFRFKVICSVLAILAAAFSINYSYAHENKYCEKEINEIEIHGSILQAKTVETVCDGFGGSDSISLYINYMDESGKLQTKNIMKYDPGTPSKLPKISVKGNALMVDLDSVDYIVFQINHFDHYLINYHIRKYGLPPLDNK